MTIAMREYVGERVRIRRTRSYDSGGQAAFHVQGILRQSLVSPDDFYVGILAGNGIRDDVATVRFFEADVLSMSYDTTIDMQVFIVR